MHLLPLMGNLREGYELTLTPESSEADQFRVELLDLSGLVTITTHSDGSRTVRWKMDLSPGEEEDHLMDGIVRFKQRGGIIGGQHS